MPTDQQTAGREKVMAIDPVGQLLNEEEEQATTTLTLKILRELV